MSILDITETVQVGKHFWHGEEVRIDRKISGGVYAVRLSKHHCWRRITSCRKQLKELDYRRTKFILQQKTADLSTDELFGIYCSRCLHMIYIGSDCYKKKMGRGRSSYYHADCAEIVHLV